MIVKKIFLNIIFILIALGMLYLLANALRDKSTTLSAMYSEPDNTLDVIIVGSSHVNSGYIPNILWEQNNLSACNVFSWSQPMWTSYHYIIETLKTQSPKVIVLELYGMLYGHSYIQPVEIDKTNYANSFNIDISLNYLRLIKTAENVGIEITPFENFLNLPKYHTRWKNLDWNTITYNPHDDKDYLKGYGLSYLVEETLVQPQFDTDTVFQPYEFAVEYLEKITMLCEKEGIELIFTLTPYIYNEREVEIYNWIENYSEQNDIEFYNYNGADGERIGIDITADLFDSGHLNYYGANKVTQDLSSVLERYITAEKSDNDNSVGLNEDFARYERVIAANEIMTEVDIDKYLSLALADEAYSLFIINDSEILSDEFFDILKQNDVPMPNDREHFTAAINVNKEQIVDADDVSFELFSQVGTVSFVFESEEVHIALNGKNAVSEQGGFKMVLYDNILERPLETVVEIDGVLSHREFTSDIINGFKRG